LQKKGQFSDFWSHVEELKQRLKVVIISLLVTTIFFMLFPSNPSEMFTANFWLSGLYKPAVSLVLNWIRNYVAPQGMQIISLEVGAPFEIYFAASFLLGMIASSPVIAYEIYKFVDPALYPSERKAVYPFIAGFTLLFLAGALFGLLLLAPFIVYTVIVFSQVVGSTPVLSVSDFYSMVLTTIGLTGVTFTIPIIFLILVKFGVVKTSIVSKNRVYFYFAVFVITAIITPDGGPLADLALFLPMVALWEAALLIAKRYEKQPQSEGVTEKPTETDICKYCGQTLELSEAFCPRCGRSQK
jgi:sec-independent protein translocase protein TatC